LHRSPYSNTSVLVECFTPEHGRFPLLAKGVLSKSGREGASSLQQFNPLLISWFGRGEVKTLRAIEPRSKPMPLKGERLYCGFYINELIMRLLQRGDPSESLFRLYEEALDKLATCHCVENVLRQFELNLLTELGYGLNLGGLYGKRGNFSAETYYGFNMEEGLSLDVDSSPVKVSGKTLNALAAGLPMDSGELREAKLLLRFILAFYLGDKPLKSRELFSKY